MFTYPETLGRVLIHHKLCSQRTAKKFVEKNQILVNGSPVVSVGAFINVEQDELSVNGKIFPCYNHFYLMMNKPLGVVCSTVSDSHKTVFDLLNHNQNFKNRLDKIINNPDGEFSSSISFSNTETVLQNLKCVGRLDSDTSGLLLFSTNGTFVNAMTAPENNVSKKYFVRLRHSVPAHKQSEYCAKIEKGFLLPAEKKSPAFVSRPGKASWLSDSTLEITVTEGKFHEVRRIFSGLGNFVVELKRVGFGEFVLPQELNKGEIKFL